MSKSQSSSGLAAPGNLNPIPVIAISLELSRMIGTRPERVD
jgi:hypothetical protein